MQRCRISAGPMHDVKAYILDGHQNPVPIGVPGELYIGGKGVARGYINKPGLNQERFIDNPFIPGQKLYRTGDLTRWYPLGEIEFLGRIDKQVKIRGYRIELGEIENRLMQIPGITACAVADREDAAGRKFLCAYLCGDSPKKSEIKAQLVRDLPGYMIPSYFVTIETLPFSSSGKVDRSRLPDPLTDQDAMQENFVAPVTETEQSLARIWSHVLNVQKIGRNDSFFDIGGDSLSIVSVMAKVMQEFHVDILLEDVYRSPYLKDFAAMINEAEQCAYRPILPAPSAPDYPVASAQQRMWLLQQTQPDAVAYNIPITFKLNGDLDLQQLRRAFDQLIQRHDALRTSFVFRDGKLRQRIHKKAAFELQYLQCAPNQLRSTLKGLLRPFNMESAPLMRAALIETGKGHYVLFVDMHHSISDKRSIEVLFRDLAVFYAGDTPAEKKIEYKDYAVWQQEFFESEKIALQRDYWKDVFSDELPLLNLHTDRPRPAAQQFKGARVRFKVDRKTTQKLRDFSQRQGATLFMMVLAVYNVLLSKYTGQEDIIVGTPVSGRPRQEVQDIVGVFINTLPLRNYPRADMSFSQFFEELCKNSVAAFAHADYPLERMVADLALQRDVSRNPLFDTMLVQAKGTLEPRMGDIRSTHYPFDPKIAKLDLTLEVYEEKNSLHCEFEYNVKLFRRSTIKRMSVHLCRLFDLLADEPETRLSDVAMLTQQELWEVTQGFNQTDLSLKKGTTVQSLFEKMAAVQGDKTALVVNGKTMTFSALNNRANKIALHLREMGVGRNAIVALCLGRSFNLMAGLLGVLKAGGAYLPVDPEYPFERIRFMLTDSGAGILLTDGSVDISFEGEIVNLNDVPDTGEYDNLPPVDRMEDGAYVIYTSGSTGTPKGAVLSRRGLCNLYESTKSTIAYDKEQTSVSVTTVSFDIFIGDALLPLLFGCTVALCTEEELRQPHLLAKLIEAVDAKFIQTTPTRMRIMMEDASFREAASKHIEKIVLGGEMIPPSLLKLLKKHIGARIINGYGPTEATVYATFKDLTNVSYVTIGRPVANTRIYILDQNKRPVPIGVFGEAYISGAGVASGYIKRDVLTRKRFLPDPYWPGHMMYQTGDLCAFMEDGDIEMCGRVDHQVKIRGLRIELGEIEAAMRQVKGVEEAVVKDWDEGVNKYLCAYYAMSREVSPETLRTYLGKKLPTYMVPSYFIGMEELPMTPNGKVNRKALPKPEKEKLQNRPRSRGGKLTAREKKMARVWSRILKIEGIGPDDNFFALGGDSLGVIKVQAAILQYGWSIRTKDFYQEQTLRKICARLNAEQTKTAYETVQSLEEKRDVCIPEFPHLSRAKLENVLLTGATGYLGAHILAQLADMPGTHVYCLVRGKDDQVCRQYLREVLSFYFGVQEAADILSRVSVVKGNIAEERFGMNQATYESVKHVDTIIHSAAITDHVGQAEAFYRTNVLGTKHAVDLAAVLGAALLHVSTASVSGTYYIQDIKRTGEFTEDCYFVGQNYADNEYVKSKFLAEDIVLSAISDGLNARIFRVGMLTGTMDGRFQMRPERNAFANRIKAICTIGCVPMGMLGARLEMTPVDTCAQAILMLAEHSDSKMPIYHVFNTHMMALGELVSLLEQNGHIIDVISDQEFMHKMVRLSKGGQYAELTGLMEDLNTYLQPERIVVTAERTKQLLAQMEFEWPVIDAAYVGRFVRCIQDRQSKEI